MDSGDDEPRHMRDVRGVRGVRGVGEEQGSGLARRVCQRREVDGARIRRRNHDYDLRCERAELRPNRVDVDAARRLVDAEVLGLIVGLGLEFVSVSLAVARRVAETYVQRGKGVNPAGMNFGDCFACEVANVRTRDCPLLQVGGDFA